jgi:hypothetical protein
MSVKPELAFDVCWEVYKGAKEVLDAKRGISALKFEEATKFSWRPDNRPRLNEWVADFALAGKAALEGQNGPPAWCFFAFTTWDSRPMTKPGILSA